MPGLTGKELETLLQENATSVEQEVYQKPLDEDQLAAKREELADNYIKINRLDEELKEIKKTYKDQTDPLKDSNSILLNEIKTRQQQVSGLLYYIPNYEDNMMEAYDKDGVLVSSRRLRPDEKQANIFSLANKAANQ